MNSDSTCSICSQPARQCCSACRSVYYCSKECQKKAWKKHKELCKPYKIEVHPVYGRHVIAIRHIKAGEIVLKEKPLLIGPKQVTEPICLGCHNKVDGSYKCEYCNYPLCGKNCEKTKWHQLECSILSRGAEKMKITNFDGPCAAYECITPIRCLVVSQKDNQKRSQILDLQSHVEDIAKSDLHKVLHKNIVQYSKNNFEWYDLEEEKLYEMCGILITNAFEVEKNGIKLRGLFHDSAMFAHDCMPNMKHTCDDDCVIIWRTTVPVAKGEQLTTTYTQTLWNTLQRRIHLKTCKLFMCSCKRCEDPTELDTNYSTLLCSQCEGRMLSSDPLDITASWVCIRCNHEIGGRQINWGDKSLYKELQDIGKSNPGRLETFLERYEKTLHPNHRFFVEAKYSLILYYGNFKTALYKDLTKEQHENKIKWCRELLEFVDIIDPGLSLIRGKILFELQAGLVGLAKYLFSNDLISEEEGSVYMSEAIKHLGQASEILRHEPKMANGKLDDKLNWLSNELDM